MGAGTLTSLASTGGTPFLLSCRETQATLNALEAANNQIGHPLLHDLVALQWKKKRRGLGLGEANGSLFLLW